MLCEDCGKNNAEVIIKTVINGQITQKQLCRECAQKLKLPGIQNVLAGAFGQTAAAVPDSGPKCPSCGLPLSVYNSRGILGCDKCYSAFSSAISKKTAATDSPYNGRMPDGNLTEIKQRIASLLSKMKESSEREDYETAYTCSETIKELCSLTESKENSVE